MNLDLAAEESADLAATLEGLGFHILNDRAVPTHGKRVLDWVAFSGDREKAFGPSLEAPLERSASGHAFLSLHLALPHHRPNLVPSSRPDWRRADFERAKFLCLYSDTGEHDPLEERLKRHESPEQMLGCFTEELSSIMGKCVPQAKTRPSSRVQPGWMTDRCLELISGHRDAYKEWQRFQRPGALRYANRVKAQKRAAIAAAKRSFALRVIEECRGAGKLWDVHRRLGGVKNAQIPPLPKEDGVAVTDVEKADLLASTFEGNFGREAGDTWAPLPSVVPREALISDTKAHSLLRKLKTRKATGCDGVPSRFLKECSSQIARAVALLFNAILLSQCVPKAWRRCRVVPVPKLFRPVQASHFRPISILDSISKVWEAHIRALLVPFTATHRYQFGFCAGSSCGDAVMTALNKVIGMCEGQGPVSVSFVSLDLAKAFDRIPHCVILRALQRREVPHFLLNVIASWLSSRVYSVGVNEGRSRWHKAQTGVPQGSLLGPILFNVAIDDVLGLPFSPGFHAQYYADDGLFIARTATPQERQELQSNIDRVAGFFESIGMEVNPAKSAILNLSLGAKREKPVVSVGGVDIGEVGVMRYLGFDLDPRLNFNSHWSRVASSAKRATGAISRLVHRDPVALRFLFQERITSLFLHSLPYAPPTTVDAWRRLNGIPKFCAHLITNRWTVHGQDILDLAELPSASYLAFKYGMRYLLSCVKGGRRYGQELEGEERVGRVRDLRSQGRRHGHELVVPKSSLASWKKLQPIRLLSAWNALPFLACDLDPALCLASLNSLDKALPSLFANLPGDLSPFYPSP